MNNRVKTLILLIILFILFPLSFCRCTPTQLVTIGKGYYSGYTERAFLVIKTQDEWRTIWKVHAEIRLPLKGPPEIDFTKETVIAVFRGKCPTGGYTIEIDTIEKMKDKILVYIIETQPRPDTIVTQALTQPYHIIRIKKTILPIEFVR